MLEMLLELNTVKILGIPERSQGLLISGKIALEIKILKEIAGEFVLRRGVGFTVHEWCHESPHASP